MEREVWLNSVKLVPMTLISDQEVGLSYRFPHRWNLEELLMLDEENKVTAFSLHLIECILWAINSIEVIVRIGLSILYFKLKEWILTS